jgi:hypothetical protein
VKFHEVEVLGSISGRVDIEDGEIMQSRPGVLFRADILRYSFVLGDGGEWEFSAAHVSGYLIKKDGTQGLNRRDASFYDKDKLPAWVRGFVDSTEPHNAPYS